MTATRVESQAATASTAGHTLTLPWVAAATSQFINAKRMREVFSLALVSGKNFLFSGPGGHAKSEFLNAGYSAIEDVKPFVKSLGQGTSMEDLFGGINLDKLKAPKNATLEYDTERSFMPHRIVVFEEMFDAPGRVLMALKDVLTARELRNGDQRVPLVTRVIAAATNMSPTDLAASDRSVAALVERFPLQLEVKWSSYTEDDFLELFDVEVCDENKPSITWAEIEQMQEKARSVEVGSIVKKILAYVLAELRTKHKVTISPRTAMMAMQLVSAAAVINGRDKAVADDVRVVQYLPGCQEKLTEILEMIERKQVEAQIEAQAIQVFQEFEFELEMAKLLINEAHTIKELEDLQKEIQGHKSRLESTKITANLMNRRSFLLSQCEVVDYEIKNRITPLREAEEQKKRNQRLTEIDKRTRRDLQSRVNNCRNLKEAEQLQQELYRLMTEAVDLGSGTTSELYMKSELVYQKLSSLKDMADRRVSRFKGNNSGGYNSYGNYNGYKR
jgi:MoxR-like ATPase